MSSADITPDPKNIEIMPPDQEHSKGIELKTVEDVMEVATYAIR